MIKPNDAFVLRITQTGPFTIQALVRSSLFFFIFLFFFLKAAFHPCVNVYIYKPIYKSEIVSIVPWIFKSNHNLSTIRKR